jgi:hypothetical protein
MDLSTTHPLDDPHDSDQSATEVGETSFNPATVSINSSTSNPGMAGGHGSSSGSARYHTYQSHTSAMPPVAPLQTAPSSLATTAAARFSQAFSPLLSARRKSAILEIPPTPDSHRAFVYPSSVKEDVQNTASHSQEQLQSSTGALGTNPQQGTGSYFESNFSKIASFSSPLSSSRSRKLHPGVGQPSEESGATPQHAGTTFHTGLASHFNRDHYDNGHQETKRGVVEKALRKAKVFLDEKAKSKSRAASLWSFLGIQKLLNMIVDAFLDCQGWNCNRSLLC